MTAAVLRLKVTLNDVEPKVLRRIEVPADIKLDRLHLTLQAALGIWTLLMVAPLSLALLHQAMAMVVLTVATVHAASVAEREPGSFLSSARTGDPVVGDATAQTVASIRPAPVRDRR